MNNLEGITLVQFPTCSKSLCGTQESLCGIQFSTDIDSNEETDEIEMDEMDEKESNYEDYRN